MDSNQNGQEPLTTTPEASALAALGTEDFEAIVRASLGKDAPAAVWDALTDPAVIARARLALSAMHTDVQNQLNLANADLRQTKDEGYALGEAGKEAYHAARAGQGDWRRKALFFRRLVEQRLAFVKARTPQAPVLPPSPYGPDGTKNARRHNRQALEDLARAVIAHRDKVTSGEGGEEDDDVLWDYLDTITAFSAEGEMPLAKWLGYLDEVREPDE